MISQKPYLVRAIYDWCVDNELTPYLLTMIDENTKVYTDHLENDKQILLNISSIAVKDLTIANHKITFLATFDGSEYSVEIPIYCVSAIFAKENSEGMHFDTYNPEDIEDYVKHSSGHKLSDSSLHLKLIK